MVQVFICCPLSSRNKEKKRNALKNKTQILSLLFHSYNANDVYAHTHKDKKIEENRSEQINKGRKEHKKLVESSGQRLLVWFDKCILTL